MIERRARGHWVRGVVIGSVSVVLLLGLGSSALAFTPRDRALARSGLLRGADVGPNWVPRPAQVAKGFGPSDLIDCRTVTDATHRRRTRAAVSDVFTNAQASVSNTVSVYRSASSAANAFGVLAGTAAQSCLRDVLMQQLAKAAPGHTTARSVSIATTAEPRLGDARVAYSVDARADSESSSEVGVTATLVVVRIGRAILGATFSGSPAPPADAVEQVLLPAARRLAKTQTSRSR